ncbi:helix-turn-helix transcriptional regulator [Lactovum miscens]|uniref:DNA-binding XRE family transcriptional regulator n=1 Tax=Lactovum miscens TaxID=190387 RepID=A0A841C5J8_9LACT|nr:helix-turn-helix transcriptional regulator [Lactovum miscens]MBB5887624.1 DNA-binding XRE family transcriptional regulator [Lactovum miscens]
MKRIKLIQARNLKKITQKEMSEKLNITEISYQRIEYGTQNPKLETSLKISEILGRTVNNLF